MSAPTERPEPRRFTADDGSVYERLDPDEFPDYSDVDHVDGDAEVAQHETPGDDL